LQIILQGVFLLPGRRNVIYNTAGAFLDKAVLQVVEDLKMTRGIVSSKTSARTRLRQNLIIAIASILLMFCGLEVLVRVFFQVRPRVERFQLHPKLGWEWTPGYAAVEFMEDTEYEMVISSQGLRNEELAIPKPAGTYRIIALGDSVTEGPGVALEQTFVKLLQNQLRDAHPGHQIEVVNAGTGSYGTEQERIWLTERGLEFEPDLIMLDVYLNDSQSFKRSIYPVTVLSNFFSRHSAFYVFFRDIVRRSLVAQTQASEDFRYRFKDDWRASEWTADPQALEELIHLADRDWGLAWDDAELQVIEGEIERIARIADENDVALFVVLFPVDVQVYAQVDVPMGLDKPQATLAGFVQDLGLPVLDLLPVLRNLESEDLFYDQCHFKADAHQVVADAIEQALEENELMILP
jgi:lysophospholipase L1-like esterase